MWSPVLFLIFILLKCQFNCGKRENYFRTYEDVHVEPTIPGPWFYFIFINKYPKPLLFEIVVHQGILKTDDWDEMNLESPTFIIDSQSTYEIGLISNFDDIGPVNCTIYIYNQIRSKFYHSIEFHSPANAERKNIRQVTGNTLYVAYEPMIYYLIGPTRIVVNPLKW